MRSFVPLSASLPASSSDGRLDIVYTRKPYIYIYQLVLASARPHIRVRHRLEFVGQPCRETCCSQFFPSIRPICFCPSVHPAVLPSVHPLPVRRYFRPFILAFVRPLSSDISRSSHTRYALRIREADWKFSGRRRLDVTYMYVLSIMIYRNGPSKCICSRRQPHLSSDKRCSPGKNSS